MKPHALTMRVAPALVLLLAIAGAAPAIALQPVSGLDLVECFEPLRTLWSLWIGERDAEDQPATSHELRDGIGSFIDPHGVQDTSDGAEAGEAGVEEAFQARPGGKES